MNIFQIPSWFPSSDYPLSGIMIREQSEAFCQMYPESTVGISLWGQKDNQYLLWSEDHLKNIYKVLKADLKPTQHKILPNLIHYHTPAFTWTRSFLNGNIRAIIQANIKNFEQFVSTYGPVDVIHAHVGHPAGLIASALSAKFTIPYCVTERMGPFPGKYTIDKDGYLLPVYQRVYQNSSINIAISPFQAEKMKQAGIKNITVIPNFIDEDFFKPQQVQAANSGNFVFFTLGYLIPEKGIDVLLHAIKTLLSLTNASVEFRIAGAGKNLAQYKDLSVALGIGGKICWLGEINRSDALFEYQHCNAFVLPSQYESMGNVYAEAIACGKPVIATRCGGPESIVNSHNGLLIDKNDSNALAHAMHQLMLTYNQYNSNGIRQDFLNRFSKKVILPKLHQLYQEMRDNKISS